MLDEIQTLCALLLSSDFADHSAAYLRLRHVRPFQRVVQRFHDHGMNMLDVAALLTVGSERPLAPVAIKMLAEELAAEASR